jgi:osmotically-inducible protein OsmY
MLNYVRLSLILIALGGFGLTGCAGAFIGAGAATGVAAAKEGGLRRAWSDTQIRVYLTDLWFRHDVDMYRRLDFTVNEGRVLITGQVPDPQMRVDAVRLAWQTPGVRQVINEIEVTGQEGGDGITGFARDAWITSRLRTKILLDRHVQSINYSIDTVGGTVYLMGVAQNESELNRVIDIARNMSYVQQVVSYVRLRGENPPGLRDEDIPASADD